MSSDSEQIVFQRSKHDSENPYAQISRSLIRDETISPECRWLLIYLLSMRDDFKINVKQIWSHAKKFIGRDKILRLIDEACEFGYMKREARYVGNLKKGVTYYVSESSQEDFKKCFRCPGFQGTEIRGTENQGALRSISSKEDITISKKEENFLPFGVHVKLTKESYDTLVSDHGKECIDEIIATIDDYILSIRKKPYDDYAATIRNWIRRNKKEDAEKKIPSTKTVNPEIIKKRIEWAEENSYTAPGGSAFADNSGYHIISGSGKPQVYHFNKDDKFWKDKGL